MEEHNDTERGQHNHGERGRVKEKEEKKKKDKEYVKYVITPAGQSLSFFQDAEIHLDLHQTAAAMAMSRVEKKKNHVTASYVQSRLSETRDRIV